MSLDKCSHVPLYEQLADALRASILSGSSVDPSGKLLTEKQLAKHFNVSRGTVRQALEILESEGLLLRKQGKGTFAAHGPKVSHELQIADTIFSALQSQVGTPLVEVLQFKFIRPPAFVLKAMAPLESQKDVLHILRTYSLNAGEPIAVVFSYIPFEYGSRFSLDDLETFQIHQLLQNKCNVTLAKGERIIGARTADSKLASLLRIKENEPVLVSQVRYLDTRDKCAAFAQLYYRTDWFQYSVTLPWKGMGRFPPVVQLRTVGE